MKEQFTNPIIRRGADPWVIKRDGRYYYCYSTGDRGVAVASADNIHLLDPKNGKVVFKAPETGPYSREYWAPELHYLNGKWYIYVAADDGDNFNHRMYCLRAKTDDPTGEFEMVGKISDATDKWAIDGTVLEYAGKTYFIWSGWEGDQNVRQDLYIAEMSDPATICSPRVLLSKPEYEWEMRDCVNGLPTINEGPVALIRNEKVYLFYSASGSWGDNYCLGMLTFSGGDPLDPTRWQKIGHPVFEKSEGSYGPGHCSFTTSPSGNEDWIIYHACVISGSSWGGRSVRIQKISWDNDLPVLGTPAKPGEMLDIPE